MDKPVKEKTKKQLDKLDKHQLERYRVKYAGQGMFNKEQTRYFLELSLYRRTRTKDEEIARYERWIKQLADPNTDKDDREVLKIIVPVITRIGTDKYYEWSVANDRLQLGEMQFIKDRK